jgi:flagellar biosynthesis anti-sigma factor FlgM
MKIQGTRQAPKLGQASRSEGKAKGAKASGASNQPAARVSLSSDAAFVGELLTDAAGLSDVRVDVVEEVRGAINDGSFEDSVDMDKVVDSLLADL